MKTISRDNYTFDASLGTVTLLEYAADGIGIEQIMLVNNATAKEIIFTFGEEELMGSIPDDSNVLTLDFDTSDMADTDDLFIVVNDPDYATPTNPQPLVKTADSVASHKAGDGIMIGGVLCVPTDIITTIAASQTDAAFITAVSDKKKRIVSLIIDPGASPSTIVFNSKGSGAGTAKSITFKNLATLALSLNELGWVNSNIDEGITITTGAGSTTSIQAQYVELS